MKRIHGGVLVVCALLVASMTVLQAARLTIFIDGVSDKGPFSLILGVGDLTVERMNQGLPGQSPTVTL